MHILVLERVGYVRGENVVSICATPLFMAYLRNHLVFDSVPDVSRELFALYLDGEGASEVLLRVRIPKGVARGLRPLLQFQALLVRQHVSKHKGINAYEYKREGERERERER